MESHALRAVCCIILIIPPKLVLSVLGEIELELFTRFICENSPVCLVGEPNASIYVRSEIECGLACQRRNDPPESCTGINHRREEKVCEMFYDSAGALNLLYDFQRYSTGCQFIQRGEGTVRCEDIPRKCCIDIVATNKTDVPNGYIQVTNVETGVVDSWEAKQAGRYLATIDVEACTTTRRNYTDWASARIRTGDTLNRWKSSFFSPELKGMFGVDVAIGEGGGSYAPWIDIWELGVDATRSKYGGQDRSTNIKACMEGITKKYVDFTDVVVAYA